MQLEATVAVVYPQALYSVRHVQLILDIQTRYGNLQEKKRMKLTPIHHQKHTEERNSNKHTILGPK